jgi:hypothetical protein
VPPGKGHFGVGVNEGLLVDPPNALQLRCQIKFELLQIRPFIKVMWRLKSMVIQEQTLDGVEDPDKTPSLTIADSLPVLAGPISRQANPVDAYPGSRRRAYQARLRTQDDNQWRHRRGTRRRNGGISYVPGKHPANNRIPPQAPISYFQNSTATRLCAHPRRLQGDSVRTTP